MKFDVIAGAIVCRAALNDLPVSAMIDTGMARSFVPPRIAQRLCLHRRAADLFMSEYGATAANLVGPVYLRWGERIWLLETILSAPADLLAETGANVDLVIGQDVLQTMSVHIDFTRGSMRFSAPGETAVLARSLTRINAAYDRSRRLWVEVDVPGAGAVPAIVDLGSNSALMMSADFARSAGLLRHVRLSSGLIATLGGTRETIAFSLPSLNIGGLTVVDVPVDAITSWASPQPINLGLGFFRHFDLVLDLSKGAIWLSKTEDTGFDREMSGLLLAHRGTELEVVHIALASPAAASDIKIGERILAVDGHPVTDAYFANHLWRWRYGPADRSVVLTLADRMVHLRLRRYY